MAEPLGGIVITSREIYDAVVRLTGRVDVLIAQQTDTKNDVIDHENRIRGIERNRWPIPAVSVLISLGALGFALLEAFK